MNKLSETIQGLFREARKDPEYALRNREYTVLEEKLALMTQKMMEEEQDLIWAFISTSDAMNWRMLEWMCERFGIE